MPAGGNRQLFTHQIKPAHLLTDRMLDLQSRVDFQEIHFALLGEHELAGAEPHIIYRLKQAARVAFQRFKRFQRHEGGRGLLDEFLVAPLHRAVARRIHDEIAVAVTPALGFHMPRLVDEPFDEILVQIPALERIMA